jgi:hypothetical protein
MHLVLVNEAVDVGNALVRFALIIQQNDLNLLAIHAAGRVDRLELIFGQLAILQTVLHHHPERNADADHPILGVRR